MKSTAKKATDAPNEAAAPGSRATVSAQAKRRTAPKTTTHVGKNDVSRVTARRNSPPTAFKGDAFEVISKMRSGTPARTIAGIASSLGLSQDRLFDLLRLPKSTVKGRISSDGKLSATEQDRVYRAGKVLSRAVQVLEDEEAAKAWLSRHNRSLGGEVPLALLDTEVGYELVLDTLGRIEYGVIS
jgi:putative toxin-antitoxin system antitoxin component (TIGR02293 family)